MRVELERGVYNMTLYNYDDVTGLNRSAVSTTRFVLILQRVYIWSWRSGKMIDDLTEGRVKYS